MNSRAAYPFLTIPDELVQFGGWLVGKPGEPLNPAGETMEGWDYESELEVCAEIAVDFETVAAALKIPEVGIRLVAVVTIGTGAGKLPRRIIASKQQALQPGDAIASIREQISSRKLSGRLWLGAQLCLADAQNPQSRIAPVTKSSRLWSSSTDVLLEGGGDSRFPMELASFSKVFAGRPEQSSPWLLMWNPQHLNHDFVGSVRLYVNSDRTTFADRFIAGEAATLQPILGDVMSQMIGAVLDFDDSEEQLSLGEPSSVGGQIRQWIDVCFPGQAMSSVKAFRDVHPGRFRATILAAADTGDIT